MSSNIDTYLNIPFCVIVNSAIATSIGFSITRKNILYSKTNTEVEENIKLAKRWQISYFVISCVGSLLCALINYKKFKEVFIFTLFFSLLVHFPIWLIIRIFVGYIGNVVDIYRDVDTLK